MKKVHNKLLLAALAFAMVFGSCKKDFLDVNVDPNRSTDENITAELLFTQGAVSVGMRAVGGSPGGEGARTDLQFAENWVGYMAATGDFAIDQIETTYNIDFAFGDNSWQRDYKVLFDLNLVKTKALAAGNEVLAGAAMILSAKMFQELVDTYGDIPYSQAFQNDAYNHPAYDAAQDVYTSLQTSLDSAITYMDAEPLSTFPTVDIVNHGDQAKWQRFANTLKLRLLIRQSEVAGFDPAAEIAKIQAKGGVLTAGDDVSVNPGFSNSAAKQSPFYGNYGFTPTGNAAANGFTANNYVMNILASTNDIRITRFFTTNGGFYVGSDYGLVTGNPTGAQASYFGEGLVASAEQDQFIYPSYESMFLEAEAIARGWMSGDAKAAFESAITQSFVWLGVPDAEAEAALYIQETPEADWANAGATVGEQVRFIAFQKYIAMCCTDPKEAWADERRLHFLPDGFISQNPSRIADELPLRLLYPQSEYTTNAENALAVGDIDQFTSKIFWQP